MKARLAKAEDTDNIIRWGVANAERSQFDPEVLLYPRTEIVCAENGQPVVYVPVQLVGMLESLCPNPEASNDLLAKGIYVAVEAILEQVAKAGIREVYFLATDEEVAAQAEKAGFEKLPWPVYRAKLK